MIEDKGPYSRPEVRTKLRKLFEEAKRDTKFVVRGANYDTVAWAIRSVTIEVPKAPMIEWGKQYLGKSPYLLGATGPPGLSDCSAFTQNAARAVHSVTLVHSAEIQARDDAHFRFFHEADDLEPDDFVFLNYGRKVWPAADHVELWVGKGRTLGSRPSTNGVNYYNFNSYDASRVTTYGRLKQR
jgi:cell wall-associated NlpC family hydrolase